MFIWINNAPEQVSDGANVLLLDSNNTLLLSLVSLWEMQIKVQLGKLSINAPLPQLWQTQQEDNDLQLLSIDLAHIWALEGLPHHHRDPFDRLLIAQAIAEQLPIVSADEMFDRYPVQRVW